MSRLCVALITLALIAPISAATGPAVFAGVSAPTLISPIGDAGSVEPQLRWMRLSSTDSYRVQVSGSSGFTTIEYDVVTTNLSTTPEIDLPTGVHHWRVRANTPGTPGPWAAATFTKTASIGTPTQLSPADGAVVDGPASAPVLLWSPVSGAASYEVEFSESAAMTDPFWARRGTTSLVIDFGTLGTPLFWRVRALARNGTTSGPWSGIRSFDTSFAGAPAGLTPANSANVRDINLAWDPMPGVPRYVLEITPGPVPDWGAATTQTVTTEMTRFQFEDRNAPIPATWVWRVRARDADGNDGPWSEERTVNRVLSVAPSLTAPAVGASVGDTPSLAWTPVVRAGFYQVDVSTDSGFAAGVATYHTTETTIDLPSSELSPFVLAKGATYHWRVRGIDNPAGQFLALNRPASPWSSPSTFVYDPAVSSLVSPADGATVDVPTLTWNAVNAMSHRVTIEDKDGSIVDREMTSAHSYTPAVALDPSDSPFSWYVERVALPGDDAADVGWKTPERSFNLVALAPTATTPSPLLATGSHSFVSPSLSWSPVVGAHHYNIFRFVDFPADTLPEDEPNPWNVQPLHFPAFTYALGNLDVGSYLYLVRAYDANGDLLAHGPSATFVVDALSAPVLTSPADCSEPGCPVHADSPRLSWQPVVGAIRYLVGFDSGNAPWQVSAITHATSFLLRGDPGIPSGGLPRTWFVYACVEQRCSARASAGLVLGLPEVELATPGDDAVVDGPQVTLSWEDYLSAPTPAGAVGTHRSEANTYQAAWVTVGNGHGQSLDGLEHTTLMASGIYEWWVLAHIGAGASSPEVRRALTVVHAGPDLVAPGSGSLLPRTPNLTWDPTPYTGSYQLEIFSGVSTATANRVVQVTTPAPAFTPEAELGSGTYSWRVRSELQGMTSDWGPTRTFTISDPTGPALSEPADGHRTASGILLFGWQSTAGAVAYRFESSASPTFSSTRESVVTGQRMWAPLGGYPRGTWYWRVTALGATNAILARSSVRTVHSDAPTAPSATVAAAGGTTQVSGATPFTIAWPGHVAPAGSVTYELARATNGGAFATLSASLASPSAVLNLAPGHRYRFAVRSVENSGDRSPWAYGPEFRVSIYNEKSSRITYRGAWSTTFSSGFVEGRDRYARGANARATFRFTGSQVAWVASVGPSRGRAKVYVDGVLVQTVNLNAATPQTRRIAYSKAWSSSGPHVVRIVVVGTPGHPRIDVDAFVIKQ